MYILIGYRYHELANGGANSGRGGSNRGGFGRGGFRGRGGRQGFGFGQDRDRDDGGDERGAFGRRRAPVVDDPFMAARRQQREIICTNGVASLWNKSPKQPLNR